MKIKRMMAIIIDILLVSFIVLTPFEIIDILFNIENRALFNGLEDLIFMVLLLSKDVLFKGESLGKRIVKIELQLDNHGRFDNIIKILRNLTIYIFPIELLFLIFSDKRLGDIIFKTKVVEKDILI